MKTVYFFSTCFILAFSNLSVAQSEMLDETFDTDGMVTTDIGTNTDLIYSIAIQSDQKIVAVGSTKIGGVTQFAVLRYNTDGSLDNTFGIEGIVTTTIGGFDAAGAVAIQSDGKIVVAGSTFNTTLDFAVVRYNSDGTLDDTFDTDGIVIIPIGSGHDAASSMLLQPDGKIVLAGRSAISTKTHFSLVRLNTNGSLDNTFDNDGILITIFGTNASSDVLSIALQSDGKIVATGDFMPSSNTDGVPLARYNTDGSLDNTFGSGGQIVTHAVTYFDKGIAMAIQTDGKIIIISEGEPSSEDNAFVLLRYNTDGTPDIAFGTNGIIPSDLYPGDDTPGSLVLQPDGKIIVAGFSWVNSFPDFSIARYLSNGSFDTSFGTAGRIWTDFGTGTNTIRSIALQADGKIVVGGGMNSGTPTSDFALARYNNDIVTGRNDLSTINSTHVYPNPSNDKILFITTKPVDINIYNYSGQIIISLNNTNCQVDISDLHNGIYFLELTMPDTKASSIYKFVKD